jgi:hypothetical protein
MLIESTRKLRARPRGHANAYLDDEREAQERLEHNVELVEAAEDSAVPLESAEPALDFVAARPGFLDGGYGSNRTGHTAPSEYQALARASRPPSDPLPDSPLAIPVTRFKSSSWKWWPGTESNHRHADFQDDGEPGSVRASRRLGRSFRGNDRTALWVANSQCDAIRTRRAVLHVPAVMVERRNYSIAPA